MHRITQVKVLDGFQLQLAFEGGTAGTVDLAHLAGKGVFKPWMDRRFFETVRIGSGGELVWADEIDLCPDALYLKVTDGKASSVSPAAPPETSHA